MILVLNKRTDRIPPGAIYVGRPSTHGNPFVIGRDGTREEVVARYEQVFKKKIETDPKFVAATDALQTASALVCWCAPELCHADIIASYLNKKFGGLK